MNFSAFQCFWLIGFTEWVAVCLFIGIDEASESEEESEEEKPNEEEAKEEEEEEEGKKTPVQVEKKKKKGSDLTDAYDDLTEYIRPNKHERR